METQEHAYLAEGVNRGLNIFQLEIAMERLILEHEVRRERESDEKTEQQVSTLFGAVVLESEVIHG